MEIFKEWLKEQEQEKNAKARTPNKQK